MKNDWKIIMKACEKIIPISEAEAKAVAWHLDKMDEEKMHREWFFSTTPEQRGRALAQLLKKAKEQQK